MSRSCFRRKQLLFQIEKEVHQNQKKCDIVNEEENLYNRSGNISGMQCDFTYLTYAKKDLSLSIL